MAGRSFHFGASLILTLVFSLKLVSSQFLTPPAFNLAEGRNIYASATCGEGVSEPELFCKLTGATGDRGHRYLAAEPEPLIYQGQLCDHCNPDDVDHAHPPTHAIDGSQRWWQSPPLSRGLEYNSVNLTIDLGQVRDFFKDFFRYFSFTKNVQLNLKVNIYFTHEIFLLFIYLLLTPTLIFTPQKKFYTRSVLSKLDQICQIIFIMNMLHVHISFSKQFYTYNGHPELG